MVARRVGDFCALAGFMGELIKDAVIFLCPVPAFFKFPAIDNITHKKEVVTFGGF